MKRIDNLCQSNAFPGLVEVRPPRKPILLLIPRPCILRGIRWHAQPFLFGCTWNSLTCSAIFVRLHFKSESKWRMQFLCTWVDRTSGCLRWRAYSFSHYRNFAATYCQNVATILRQYCWKMLPEGQYFSKGGYKNDRGFAFCVISLNNWRNMKIKPSTNILSTMWQYLMSCT